jgi:hypothetical protein
MIWPRTEMKLRIIPAFACSFTTSTYAAEQAKQRHAQPVPFLRLPRLPGDGRSPIPHLDSLTLCSEMVCLVFCLLSPRQLWRGLDRIVPPKRG